MFKVLTVVVGAVVMGVAGVCAGQGVPADGHHRHLLTGPWELVVQVGEGESLAYAVGVEDINVAEELGEYLPVMGSPVEVVLEEYLPDTEVYEEAVEGAGGGAVVRVRVSGPGLEQGFWLDGADAARRSVVSPVGSVGVVGVEGDAGEVVRGLVGSEAVGLLRVEEQGRVRQYAAAVGEKVEAGGYEIEVVEYWPHFAVDATTGEVSNRSEEPVNPAVRVRVTGEDEEAEDWLWARLPDFTHGHGHGGGGAMAQSELPLKVRYEHVRLRGTDERPAYTLAAGATGAWVLRADADGALGEPLKVGQAYRLGREYSFEVESVVRGELVERWRKRGEELGHPGVVVRVASGGAEQRVLVQLNRPEHVGVGDGVVVLGLRQEEED